MSGFVIIQVLLLLTHISPGQQTASRDTEAPVNNVTEVHNTTPDVLGVQPTSQTPDEPLQIDIKLINGRQFHEGLVLIKPNNSDVWGTVCDDGWDDADATVVCRQLGYKAGLARYPPLYGSVDIKLPIYLDDLACLGTESTLLDCKHRDGWSQSNCNHREDAGVQCFINEDAGSEHVFGYPAVYRQSKDEWKEGVYIPHPQQHLPWGEGTITGWVFYTNSKQPADVTLQIWRRKSEFYYQLQGETQFVGLSSGNHTIKLQNNGQIKFSAGDVLGIAFPNDNPIPFDSLSRPCDNGAGVMYMLGENMLKQKVGTVSYFKKKPEAWSSCRMYSVYATYLGVEYNDTNTFSYGNNIYHMIMDNPIPQLQADFQCKKRFGSRAELLMVMSEYEMVFINGALNSFTHTPNRFWIGGRVHQFSTQYYKWAHCEPAQGKECIMLQMQHSIEDDLTSKQFLMFSVNCTIYLSLICKIPALTTTTVITSAVPFSVKTSIPSGLSKGAVVSLGIIPVFIMALLIVGIIIHKWRTRKYERRGESIVGFVHLEDDKVNI